MTTKKFVKSDIDARALVRILPEWKLPDVSIYALTGTRLLPSKVRIFVEYLAKYLPKAIADSEGNENT